MSQPWSASILTLYPEMFPGPLGVSLAGRALAEGKWACDPIQIRDFAADKHRTVDDTPAGGGAGMVLRADVLGKAVDHALDKRPDLPEGAQAILARVLSVAPKGRPQAMSEFLAELQSLAKGHGAGRPEFVPLLQRGSVTFWRGWALASTVLALNRTLAVRSS